MLEQHPCGCIVDLEEITSAAVKLCPQHEAEAEETVEAAAAEHGARCTRPLQK